MSEQRVLTQRQGHVLEMTINRPEKRNAFDLAMLEQLSLAYGVLDRDPELWCGLLYPAGDHFSAGLDLAEVGPAVASNGFLPVPTGGIDPFGVTGPRLSKPLVVAGRGWSLTVAIELMLAADVRICADDARFGQIEVQRGIFPFGGATVRLVREAGWGNAMRYILTGDHFDAAEALRIGLVQEVVAPGELVERGRALAQRIAAQAPLGVQESLRSARQVVQSGEQQAFALFPEQLQKVMSSEDAAEGVRSFLERREARFSGR